MTETTSGSDSTFSPKVGDIRPAIEATGAAAVICEGAAFSLRPVQNAQGWYELDDYMAQIERDLQQEWGDVGFDDIMVQDEFGEWGVLQ